MSRRRHYFSTFVSTHGTKKGRSGTNDPRQSVLSLRLYRQLLRWCDQTGNDDVPFDPIPPVTLSQPLVDGMALSAFASYQIHDDENRVQNEIDEDEERRKEAETNPLSEHSNENVGQWSFENFVISVQRNLPDRSIVTYNQIVCPVQNASDVRGVVKVAYRMNHPTNRDGRMADDGSEQKTYDADVVKERISNAFDAVKSLNELTEVIEERKLRREGHVDRTGVQFHVGQVVQHKTERWRGIVTGWTRGPPPSSEAATATTSLTTKEYSSIVDYTGETARVEEDDPVSIQYSLILDSGDGHLLNVQRRTIDIDGTGLPVASQVDLEPVMDGCLTRIRSNWVSSKFDSFDSTRHRFVPNDVLAYEYPDVLAYEYPSDDGYADDAPAEVVAAGTTPSVGNGTDSKDGERDSTAPTSSTNASSSHIETISEELIVGVRNFASHLQWHILDATSNSKGLHSNTMLAALEQRLSALSKGNVGNASDQLSGPSSRIGSSSATSQALATFHLQSFLHLTLHLSELLWSRQLALRHKSSVQFKLGTIVKHKLFDFRGVVIGWDPKPTVDVRNWDGLHHIENPEEKPFYHITPDQNDCRNVFGGERPFRYVCGENLEVCPADERRIEVYPPGMWDKEIDWSEFGGWKYTPSDELKFKFAECLGDEEESIVGCLERIWDDVCALHLHIRDEISSTSSSSDLGTISETAHKLSMDNLFLLLQSAESMEDAMVLEETMKEIWKAHANETIRWTLDDGTADLLRGRHQKALETFTSLVTNDDPSYFEAWNKKATCHYMLGEMQSATEATKRTLELFPRHFQAWNGLGLVQFDTKRHRMASEAFRRSLVLDPWSPVSSRLMVCVDLLEELGGIGKEEEEEEGAEEGSAPYEPKS